MIQKTGRDGYNIMAKNNKKKSIARQIAEGFTDPLVVMSDPLGSYTGSASVGDNATGRIITRYDEPTQDADDL